MKQLKLENFYMIGEEFKKYEQGQKSSMGMNFIWGAIVGPLFLGYMLWWGPTDIFFQGMPMMFSLSLFLSVISIITSLVVYFIGRKKKIKYELRNVKYSMFAFLCLSLSIMMGGYAALVESLDYSYLMNNQKFLRLSANLLIVSIGVVILISYLLLNYRINKGCYRKNDDKLKKLNKVSFLVESLVPICSSITFFIILISNSSVELADLFIPILGMGGSYIVAIKLPFLYMMYYLRKRFPEEYLENYER